VRDARRRRGVRVERRGEQSGTIRGQIRWAGIDSKYFLSAVVPTHPVQTCEVRLSDDAAKLVNTISSNAVTLEPNESRTYEFGLYMGTKEMESLSATRSFRACTWKMRSTGAGSAA
jgi:YidC/Oxa1 family membrane protein insertase